MSAASTGSLRTWEEAVGWLRAQNDKADLVRACYYDDPVEEAAQRFASGEEWKATLELLGSHIPGRVLDVGAGRGIASYAFARAKCEVTALEPDSSAIVGRGAIEEISRRCGTPIRVVASTGERLPLEDGSFDVVYARAVLHHVGDLDSFFREVARVLRVGGIFLAVREHVISRREDLGSFLASHPLHHLYGGEHAYLLEEYTSALKRGGLKLLKQIGPLESPVNFAPLTEQELKKSIGNYLSARFGRPLATIMMKVPGLSRAATKLASRFSNAPGRHYAFLGIRS